jgi:mannose/fructose/N-acetylgalactosamine-specific phosphotransferase system component IID
MSENFLEKLEGLEIKRWMEAATILGLLVVGALAATWLNVATPIRYVIGEGDAVVTVAIQGIFDRIMPRMLALFVTLGVFGLLRKRINPTIVMIGIVVVSFLLGLFNILT